MWCSLEERLIGSQKAGEYSTIGLPPLGDCGETYGFIRKADVHLNQKGPHSRDPHAAGEILFGMK